MPNNSVSGPRGEVQFGVISLVALATGGMVGGGIYVSLGVVVEAAGQWAWLSFVIAGVVAVATAYSYAELSNHFESGGGAFDFLEEVDRRGLAGSLSWVLIVAYMLTIALYAYAFGRYSAHAFGLGAPVPRIASVVILVALVGLNLAGAGKLKTVEIAIVAANLAMLVILAVVGVADWAPEQLTPSAGAKGPWSAWIGAAAIFVSYEGFQLLTYEYDEIEDPKRILTPGLVGSAAAVVGIYVAVALGATMLAGADALIEQADVALSVAAEAALGTFGLVAMTLAAMFATSAAINSTLFSTAQLARRVAEDGELPAWFDHRNDNDVPGRAVLVIGIGAGILAVVGSLAALVEAASLVFLVAFAVVNITAVREKVDRRWVPTLALAVGAVVGVVLVVRLATTKPIALGLIMVVFVLAIIARPAVLRHVSTEPAG